MSVPFVSALQRQCLSFDTPCVIFPASDFSDMFECVTVQLNRKVMMTEADLERTDKKADAAEQYVIDRFHYVPPLESPRPRERGLWWGEIFWLRLTTASAQCLRLSQHFFIGVMLSVET